MKYYSNNADGAAFALVGQNEVRQAFTAKGNVLYNDSIYCGDVDGKVLKVAV